jgi:transcriptional regulator with XRE-family HTH domain
VAPHVTGQGDEHRDEAAQLDSYLPPSQRLAAKLRYQRATYVKPDGKKWTQEDLAAFVRARTKTPERPGGVGTRAYMWELEAGRSRDPDKTPAKPNGDVLRALAAAFNKEPGYFLTTEQDENDAVDAQLAVFTALQSIGARAVVARALVDHGLARVPGQESGKPPAANAAALWALAAAFEQVPRREPGEPLLGESAAAGLFVVEAPTEQDED